MNAIECESLFTELSLEQAEVFEGGATFRSSVNFDTLLYSRVFPVRGGGNVGLSTAVRRSYNGIFSVDLIRVRPGPDLNVGIRHVAVNRRGFAGWSNLPGASYYLRFRDRRDGRYIRGPITVSHTTTEPIPS